MSESCKDSASLMNGKDYDTERWEVMSPKEGRVKVAHTLRDKRQSNDHEAALARLEIRIKVHDDTSDLLKDSHYIAANAMILSVELSGKESETLIKALLCDAIDNVGVPAASEYDIEHEVCQSLDSPDEGIAIEILKPSKESPPEAHFNLEHKLLSSNKVAERFPTTWPLSVPLPQSAVLSCDISHIPEEATQQWTPNLFLPSNALALEHLLMNKWYQMSNT